jgi:putative ABC transport system permease protein
VRRRSREIGIRVALGAEQAGILREAVGSGTSLVAMGVVLGTLLSLALGHVFRSLLFEVAPTDVPTMLTATAIMLLVGLVGSYLPARLILMMDPAKTLREE